MKTIVAISTPIGCGGVSIIRLSGSDSFSIAKKMISKVNDTSKDFEFRKMYLCKIKTEKFFDIGLVVFFKSPESFTGENLVEFQIHGGVFLTNAILNECLKLGAVMATPGEFSKRAFLNGKMSLDACEGIIDLINSETEKQVVAANHLANGECFMVIKNIQIKLQNILAEIDVGFDYPEEDLETDIFKTIANKISNINSEIKNVVNTYSKGKIIKYGIDCAIIGLPNAGKSSLLNAMLKEERAIVSSIAGTTRDVIKESFVVDGLKINLIDTAGINEADNEIEKIGVQKAIDEARSADVVLYIFDGIKGICDEDEKLLKTLNNKKIILVKNKTDLSNQKLKEKPKYPLIEVSAKTNKNIDELKKLIYNNFFVSENKNNEILITNERHFNHLKNATKLLDECENLIKLEHSLDIVSSLLQSAYNCLGEITGEVGSEKIIDEIFEKFCLGK